MAYVVFLATDEFMKHLVSFAEENGVIIKKPKDVDNENQIVVED